MMGAILGGGFTLLALGGLVVYVCFPVAWRTPGVWLATSLLGIPALILLAGLIAAYPPLLVLALIVAFAGSGVRKKRR